jgi:hypothetical protein
MMKNAKIKLIVKNLPISSEKIKRGPTALVRIQSSVCKDDWDNNTHKTHFRPVAERYLTEVSLTSREKAPAPLLPSR